MERKLFNLLIFIWSLSFHAAAQGNLLITPMRVVFDGNKQIEELNLMNTGTDVATYSVSFRSYNMNEQGKLVLLEKPDTTLMLAEPYLRIFPRQVTLAPGEPQIIMLQCRRPPGMLAGEYRSHLWFRSEKNYEALGKEESSLEANQLSVKVIPIFGITIPVIIRSGAVNVQVTMSDLKLEILQDSIQTLHFTLNRTGNISTYGNIRIDYVPKQGKPYQVGASVGVSVYTNLQKRNVAVKLNNIKGGKIENGKLKVQYLSNGESKQVVYAEGELIIDM